ncbi:hypothetical protein [Sphingobium phenoxybenzoativorans]|uniref:hypothetical protein n=1 Tax=Sphingobium phenoxybenzoativorans TaxID=1592790 RepID=UPI00087203CC|nr:hypothetical protein [Sphingobium phenoxybenzoativorans]
MTERISLSEVVLAAERFLGRSGARLWIVGQLNSGVLTAIATTYFCESTWQKATSKSLLNHPLDQRFWGNHWTHDGDRIVELSDRTYTNRATYSADWTTASFAAVTVTGGGSRTSMTVSRAYGVTVDREEASALLLRFAESPAAANQVGRITTTEQDFAAAISWCAAYRARGRDKNSEKAWKEFGKLPQFLPYSRADMFRPAWEKAKNG